MTPQRSLPPVALVLLLVLCASWGAQQVAVKAALTSFPPFMQMGLRSVMSVLLIGAYCLVSGKGRLTERDGTLWPGLLVGLLFTSEFVAVYLGLQWTDAGRSSLLLYTAPFFVALGAAWLLPGERMKAWQWAGLVLSFGGTALVLGVPRASASMHGLLGDACILAGGALWGATTLAIKASRKLAVASAEKILLYQLLVSAVAGLAGCLALSESLGALTLPALAGMLYQSVWVVGVTYLMWFRMLGSYPAALLQAGTSMTPLFGVSFAALLAGEPITPMFGVAVLLMVLGLLLVNRGR